MSAIDAEDLQVFLLESYEILAEFEQTVLNLEKSTLDAERLNQLYRALHTIKGNSGFIPFPKLEAIAHAGETLLEKIRSTHAQISPDISSVLLQLIDAIRQILDSIQATQAEGDRDYSRLIASLTSLCPEDAPNRSERVEEIESTATALDPTIRVQVNVLDHLMNLVGELVLVRNRVLQLTTQNQHSELLSACQQINLITSELQESVMRTRMQPISTLWRTLPRFVRNVAVTSGKEVELTFEGGETELDRAIIAAIKDPLTHLIRNCIDHGIEPPNVRQRAGKAPQGHLVLKASQQNGTVIIEVRDDGAGIDIEQLKSRSQQLGSITATQSASMSDREAMRLIFQPGFSTATEVTSLSGRGFGMDVVRQNLETISGTVEVDSQLRQGTLFRLRFPLTLAIIPTLLITSGGEQFAIPQSSVQELIRIEGELDRLLDVSVYRLRGEILPIVNLASVLQLSIVQFEVLYCVVIEIDHYRFGLIVDAIEDTQDIVVKPLSKQLRALEMFAGATILGDGKVALILDAAGLARLANIQPQPPQLAATTNTEASDRPLILIIRGVQNARMGIVLNHATRLETVQSSTIEQVGEQYLMQYRVSFGEAESNDRVIVLVDLQAVFTGVRRTLDQFDETISIVVVELSRDRTIGIIVDEILDIVEEPLTATGAAIRPGSQCYATVQGQITEILDVNAIVDLANPYRAPELSRR
ncbi:chemotaxis protein CheA [Leptolyngbya sp. AN03gr2]|uniref:chemotaxis protein CheA n=1 Tax=unclassified Leptolyngbya TaxID=2650499 RepID=UPI003D311883